MEDEYDDEPCSLCAVPGNNKMTKFTHFYNFPVKRVLHSDEKILLKIVGNFQVLHQLWK